MILTATSGDTGIGGDGGLLRCAGHEDHRLLPHGGVSAVQQTQMATQAGENVCVCAVRGNFDDAQTGVKIFSAFGKDQLLGVRGVRLRPTPSTSASASAGRLCYRAYADLVQAEPHQPGDKVDYVVPTGNFGDISRATSPRKWSFNVTARVQKIPAPTMC